MRLIFSQKYPGVLRVFYTLRLSTIGSHADQKTSTLTETRPDPLYQIALASKKLANKNSQQSLFHPKNTLAFSGKKWEEREI